MILGSICEQPPRFDGSKTSSEDCFLNGRMNWNCEALNRDINLVNGKNQIYLITTEEEYFNDKDYYDTTTKSNMKEWLKENYANSKEAIDAHNDNDMKQNQERKVNHKCVTH